MVKETIQWQIVTGYPVILTCFGVQVGSICQFWLLLPRLFREDGFGPLVTVSLPLAICLSHGRAPLGRRQHCFSCLQNSVHILNFAIQGACPAVLLQAAESDNDLSGFSSLVMINLWWWQPCVIKPLPVGRLRHFLTPCKAKDSWTWERILLAFPKVKYS